MVVVERHTSVVAQGIDRREDGGCGLSENTQRCELPDLEGSVATTTRTTTTLILKTHVQYSRVHYKFSGFAHLRFSILPVFGQRISCHETGSIVAPDED